MDSSDGMSHTLLFYEGYDSNTSRHALCSAGGDNVASMVVIVNDSLEDAKVFFVKAGGWTTKTSRCQPQDQMVQNFVTSVCARVLKFVGFPSVANSWCWFRTCRRSLVLFHNLLRCYFKLASVARDQTVFKWSCNIPSLSG